MATKSTPKSYVPVTLQLSPDLAQKLSDRNYNWNSLIDLFDSISTEDLVEAIRIIYFEYTRLLIQHQSDYSSKTVEALFIMQSFHEALFKMNNSNH